MSYELYGLISEAQYNGYACRAPEETRELIATFSDHQTALAYVRASELRVPKTNRFNVYEGKYRYRKHSVLRNYENYEICEFEEEAEVPHNPSI